MNINIMPAIFADHKDMKLVINHNIVIGEVFPKALKVLQSFSHKNLI